MSLEWLIFTAAVFLILQGWIYSRWGLKRLHYARWFNNRAVFEGDEAELIEQIENDKLLPLPWFRIESKMNPNLLFEQQNNLSISHNEFHRSIFSLMPYTGITRRHKLKCLKRGCYRLNSAAMTYGDAFGIQERTRDLKLDAQILVYPKSAAIEDIPFQSHNWQGDIVTRRWIVDDPFMRAGVREYRPGDALNRISWKATARTGDLRVFSNDYTSDPRLMIYLNVDQSESMWEAVTDPDRVEKGISYSSSIAQFAYSNGIPVGFGSNAYHIDDKDNSIRLQPFMSEEHITLIMDTLSKLIIARSTTFHTFLEQDINTAVSDMDFIIITCYISERMNEQIEKLKANGNSVEIVSIS